MSELEKRRRIAIEAIARHFCATCESGKRPPDATIALADKRIALQVTVIQQPAGSRDSPDKPSLRFDRVAIRLIGRLRAALHGSVPDGCAVVLTITAPIRLPSRTAMLLGDRIRGCLARQSARATVSDTIHGNWVRIRVLEHEARGASPLVGFVHHADTDPDLLLDITRSLLDGAGAQMRIAAPASFAGERWLVIAGEVLPSHIAAYRHAWSQLAIPTGFAKILLVLPAGQVEPLSG
jgi:hypothetical protein